jgi:hypothetical protein
MQEGKYYCIWYETALSVLLRFTASGYPFGIFKLFLNVKKLMTMYGRQKQIDAQKKVSGELIKQNLHVTTL